MKPRRLDMHRLQELVRLHRMKTPVREIARLLGMGPSQEREYRRILDGAGLLDGGVEDLPELLRLREAVLQARPLTRSKPSQELSSVSAWRPQVEKLMDRGLKPRAIFDRLRLQEEGFQGRYPPIKRLCRAIRAARGVRPEDVAIPVETLAGEIAQVDFGYVGRMLDPGTHTLRRAWCFVMVLGFSRHMVVRLVFDQRTETWLDLHVQAFEELGGVVETVVPDNLKAAVVRAAFGVDGASELNRSYRELARHYGMRIDPTPSRAPRKKGKVESAVKYVKHNGLKGLEDTPIDGARQHLKRWVREVAGVRCHGTTGMQPLKVFEEVEAAALKPLPSTRFAPVIWKKATVHPDTHVAFQGRLYSVPWRYVGKVVWLQATGTTVAMFVDDVRVAWHDRRGPGYRSTVEEHLPEQRRDYRHRSRAYWEKRADAVGTEVGAYIREVFDADDVLSQLRTVQAMVTHLERFPPHRARAACARARHYGSHGYRSLKDILQKGLDIERLPVATSAPSLTKPRFARSVKDLLPFPREVNDERN